MSAKVSVSQLNICVVNITQEKEDRERENMFAIGVRGQTGIVFPALIHCKGAPYFGCNFFENSPILERFHKNVEKELKNSFI